MIRAAISVRSFGVDMESLRARLLGLHTRASNGEARVLPMPTVNISYRCPAPRTWNEQDGVLALRWMADCSRGALLDVERRRKHSKWIW